MNITPNNPRIFVRSEDRAKLIARKQDPAGWKDWWDGPFLTRIKAFKALTPQAFANQPWPYLKFCGLAFAGWLEENARVAGGYRDANIKAMLWLADNNAAGVEPDSSKESGRRERLRSLAVGYDLLWQDLTDVEKTRIEAEIVRNTNKMTANTNEMITGHSGQNQLFALEGALAIHGHNANSQRIFDRAIRYFLGTPGKQDGRLDTARHAQGADLLGGSCTYNQEYLRTPIIFTVLLTNGTDENWFTQELPWLSQVWEWLAWTGYRPFDANGIASGDMANISVPFFEHHRREMYGSLIGYLPDETQRRVLRWYYDEFDAVVREPAENKIKDFLFFDRATVQPLHPKDSGLAKTKFFPSVGIYCHRDTWDNEQPGATWFLTAQPNYHLGHRHLSAGSVA
jgi:hypothetical protein